MVYSLNLESTTPTRGQGHAHTSLAAMDASPVLTPISKLQHRLSTPPPLFSRRAGVPTSAATAFISGPAPVTPTPRQPELRIDCSNAPYRRVRRVHSSSDISSSSSIASLDTPAGILDDPFVESSALTFSTLSLSSQANKCIQPPHITKGRTSEDEPGTISPSTGRFIPLSPASHAAYTRFRTWSFPRRPPQPLFNNASAEEAMVDGESSVQNEEAEAFFFHDVHNVARH